MITSSPEQYECFTLTDKTVDYGEYKGYIFVSDDMLHSKQKSLETFFTIR